MPMRVTSSCTISLQGCGYILLTLVLLAIGTESSAQTGSRPSLFGAKSEIPLYAGVAPGSEKWDYSEIELQGKSGPQVKNVVRPTLLYFPAAHPVGTAMIVAPGGGTRSLMMSYEGFDIAKKLNEAGVDAFVLKYRLIQTGPGIDGTEPAKTGPQAGQNVRELAAFDGRRSLELVRSRAAEFKIQPNRIGMIGFSAGGGPIRGAMAGNAETRPDFAVLIYGASSKDNAVTVPAGAPPLFLAVAADDPNYEASLATFLAWRKANVPVELHIFQMGAHGFVNKGGGADRFMDRVGEWMQVNGWLPKRS
ncbi:MAG: alpha/beta hydrolase [Opitutus sp.]|nr:alpha/beta hydrolase [Opitutus sp.]